MLFVETVNRRAVLSTAKVGGTRITRIILPGLLNFIMFAGAAALLLSGMLNFMMLFMGDICIVMLVGAVIALVWFGCVGLVINHITLRKLEVVMNQ